jgi:STE24 endopeptidase
MQEQEKVNILDKAKKYSSIKYTLAIIGYFYILVLLLLFQGLRLSQILANSLCKFISVNYLIIPAYLLIVYVLYYFLVFPLNFYGSFILEHKFCLSNQKIQDWFKDQIKAGIISYIIALIMISVFYYILKHYIHTWWLIVSCFWIFFSLIFAKVTPIVIIPLFFKYKPLTDTALRVRIINLAERMKIKILDVFEIDFSKKTAKANAAFVGVGKTKRVILADTLRGKYSYDEIEVILAHEFAHYKLKHLLKLILLNSMAIIITLLIIFKTSSYTLSLFGISKLSDIAALPIVLIYFVILGIIMQPFENYLSRRLERNADIIALKVTGLKEAFISMMEKLASQNLADRNPHPLIKFFFFDHPPVDERIALTKLL